MWLGHMWLYIGAFYNQKPASAHADERTVLWKTEITVENYPCEIALYLYGSTGFNGSRTRGKSF